jgi:P pilus assembly chaperone PapD
MARDKNMRTIVRLYFGLGLSIALIAPACAELAMTGTSVTMRAGPTGKAGIVQRIPQRAEIVLEKCVHNWCRASWRGQSGYIPAGAVVLGPPPATLPGDEMPPPVVYGSPTYITPPAWRWTGPYVGLNGGFGSGSW